MNGVTMLHVPYRGEAPALTDLIGGQVQVMFTPMGSSIEYIRTGKLRALAVTALARLDALPGVPTMGEYVPGYEASGWFGIGVPTGTPPEIVERLNKEINAGLADSAIEHHFAELGVTPFGTSPADFSQSIAADIEKWARLIRAANIKPQ
jgi:tripartite-type tricarboxylate transporter receptor subunit TctC